MKKILVILILFLMTSSIVWADRWPLPKREETFSENKEFMFVTDQSEKEITNYEKGGCIGTLYSIKGEEKKEIWSRFLINNLAPVHSYTADSGKYVVTMDEWHNVGKFPVVIYGRDGELIRVMNLDDLGIGEGSANVVRSTRSSYWWNADAIIFFGPEDETLFIRTHWGKMIMIELETGDRMDNDWFEIVKSWPGKETEWATLKEYGKTQTKTKALEYLKSDKPEVRQAGVKAAGQLKLKEAIPELRKMLTDKSWYFRSSPGDPYKMNIVFYLREEAKKALELLGEEVGDVVTEAPEEGNLIDEGNQFKLREGL